MRSSSLPVQKTGHVGTLRAVQRHASDAGHVFTHVAEGSNMVPCLERELSLVTYEINPIEVGDRGHLRFDDLDLRANDLRGANLRNVAQSILPLPCESERIRERQHNGAERTYSSHRSPSFDFDVHHAVDTRAEQAPRRPYDWSLDEPGKAFHVGPMTPGIPPDLDPHVMPRVISLSASRASRLEVLRSTILAYAAIGFIAAIGMGAFYGAAIRMPEVRQASIDAEGV